MSNPQPHHLKDKPKRAEPWQPDRPNDGEPEAAREYSATDEHRPKHVVAGYDKPQDTSKAVSSEAAIPRDPQTGQALNDESLTSDDPAGLSDGASGSARLPES